MANYLFRAKAFKAGLNPSPVAGRTYNVFDPTPPPPPSGWLSHAPMRALPVANSRDLVETDVYFIAPSYTAADLTAGGICNTLGTAGGDGTLESPWKTFAQAAAILTDGDTLYLVGGVYRELGVWSKSGTSAPITIAVYPGEIAYIDPCYPEFYLDPDTAWEPCPPSAGGIEGEYWSTGSYSFPGTDTHAAGNFGDSMVPLFRYRSLFDLRSQNEYRFDALNNNNYQEPTGIWLGPGVYWNAGTGRIHVRLAHTHIPQIDTIDLFEQGDGFSNNYTGVEDPREVPLIICKQSGNVTFTGQHFKVQDVVVRGANRLIANEANTTRVDTEFDGVHMFGGRIPYGMYLGGADPVLRGCKLRGNDAPWSSRWGSKNRSAQGTLLSVFAPAVTMLRNEFSDNHNGLDFKPACVDIEMGYNQLENLPDDMTFWQPRGSNRMLHVYQNRFRGATTTLSFYATQVLPPSQSADAGMYARRNEFDLRYPIYSAPPNLGDEANPDVWRYPNLSGEHGNYVPRPDIRFYQNNIYVQGTSENGIEVYMSNLAGDSYDALFSIYNNLLIQVNGTPRQNVDTSVPSKAPPGSVPGTITTRNNLEWTLATAGPGPVTRTGDIHADPHLTLFTADFTDGVDAHLQDGSPAINAGYTGIPAEWPDELRSLDAGNPDIGAIPSGVTGEVFGPGAEV